MWRIVITGLALICVIAIGSLAATREPRSAVIDAVTRTPMQVEVTNFPAVQAVAGTVNVGNFPAAAPITVNVATPTIHFVGFSPFPAGAIDNSTPNILDLNRLCNVYIPGTRACIKEEVALSIPPPTTWPDLAWTLEHVTETSNSLSLRVGCLSEIDTDLTPCGQGPHLVACCGF